MAMNIQSGMDELLVTRSLVIVGTEAKQPIAKAENTSIVFFRPNFSDRAAQKTLPKTEPIDSIEMKLEANYASTISGSLALKISFIRGLQEEKRAIPVAPYITKVRYIRMN